MPGLLAEGRVLPPLDHPDPAHCLVTGTGLTHLGSAEARDKMHQKLAGKAEDLSDSMKMFRLGLEGGKPKDGKPGVQPEWFYKGDGAALVASRRRSRLARPSRSTAARSRRWRGSISSGPTAGPGVWASRSAMNSPTMSWSGRTISISPIRSCAPAPIGPELRTGALPGDARRREPDPARRQDRSGTSPSSAAKAI